MKVISKKLAFQLAIIILFAVTVFHFLVLSGFVPYSIVWGGRLSGYNEMILFEIVSILINFIFIFILFVTAGFLKPVPPIIGKVGIWLMFGIFALNTIGNLLAAELIEKLIFTPVTMILALLSLRLALKD